MNGFSRVAVAALMLALLATGCASQRHANPAGPSAQAGRSGSQQPVLVPCAAHRCTPKPASSLGGGYTVRLWSYPAPAVPDSSTPVVELLSGGRHLSWWTGRVGYGWAATLSCLATAGQPNCVVTSALGAHAGSAEILLLRSGALTSPSAGSVIFDSSMPVAADLDGDGLLDVAGMENDYTPDYAHGHNYWATYRQTGAALHRTGCARVTAGTPPATLLTGACPKVPQD
ncbi:MAG TPA: hypothetical protein VFU36_14235 [Jatrophihabitans sp.]|nr:hypothetical protein [Jatrophihabitans sp.]